MKVEFGLSVLSKRETLLGFHLTTHNGITIEDGNFHSERIVEFSIGIVFAIFTIGFVSMGEKIGEYDFNRGLDLLPVPKTNADQKLAQMALEGLKRLDLDKDKVYLDRLEEELSVIKDKSFASYFLVVADMVNWAKDNNIMVGPGRGSAAGSLVCYSLGITDVDPIEYDL